MWRPVSTGNIRFCPVLAWPLPIIRQEALKAMGDIVSDRTLFKKGHYRIEPGTDLETTCNIIQARSQRLGDACLKDEIIHQCYQDL